MTISKKKGTVGSGTVQKATLEKALLCAQVAIDHKATEPIILHVAEIVSITDYFVICSGRSTRHVQAIAEHMQQELRAQRLKPMGIEGMREGHWVLLDLGDVVVHIFYEPIRSLYDLEGLWREAPRVEVKTTGGKKNSDGHT
ncbi:MAG: ribosome silencing factor [Deltaproteobacteria bacterium]|nr:ribosome silencing factor [Deltaproteobacteria bacterium]MBW2069753.1 ribosome silencing factor [Deltaproteobacteria bacterium]